ncbi:hypothetical protein [Fortiea sp. LEGE XX443]
MILTNHQTSLRVRLLRSLIVIKPNPQSFNVVLLFRKKA